MHSGESSSSKPTKKRARVIKEDPEEKETEEEPLVRILSWFLNAFMNFTTTDWLLVMWQVHRRRVTLSVPTVPVINIVDDPKPIQDPEPEQDEESSSDGNSEA